MQVLNIKEGGDYNCRTATVIVNDKCRNDISTCRLQITRLTIVIMAEEWACFVKSYYTNLPAPKKIVNAVTTRTVNASL